MDVRLGCKIASEVSIFVNFSIFNHNFFFLCTSPAITFLVLMHGLHYRVASFYYGHSRAKDVGPLCQSFRAIA